MRFMVVSESFDGPGDANTFGNLADARRHYDRLVALDMRVELYDVTLLASHAGDTETDEEDED